MKFCVLCSYTYRNLIECINTNIALKAILYNHLMEYILKLTFSLWLLWYDPNYMISWCSRVRDFSADSQLSEYNSVVFHNKWGQMRWSPVWLVKMSHILWHCGELVCEKLFEVSIWIVIKDNCTINAFDLLNIVLNIDLFFTNLIIVLGCMKSSSYYNTNMPDSRINILANELQMLHSDNVRIITIRKWGLKHAVLLQYFVRSCQYSLLKQNILSLSWN